MSNSVHLRNAGVSVVLDLTGPGLPGIAHWGADLGELDPQGLSAVFAATAPPAIGNTPDEPVRVALLPEHATGWLGRPGLEGSRNDGTSWAPRFTLADVVTEVAYDGSHRVQLSANAPNAGLSLTTELELTPSGLLRGRHTLRNEGPGGYAVQSLALALPVPPRAAELLDLTGRWCRERSPQRHPFPVGTWLREARGGRSGHDAVTILTAGTPDFGFRRGECWSIHLGWSGNTTSWAERTPTGASLLAAGELLQAGEVVLEKGQEYSMPWVYAAWSDRGLDGISAAFHRWLRARPTHPSTSDRPRPVTLNVWEAVYFGHDLHRLIALADAAASVGVERFVLDDGWFRHRRDDTAGLGDWYVDEGLWPQGLHPLVDHVRSRGMEFGLWFEPEMINPDSDLARAQPEWILGASSGLPPLQRHQHVLDLGQPAAFNYLLERIDALLTEYPVGYVKWDHNRHLVAASTVGGRAGVHAQTLAFYRLLAELRGRHPDVEFESCASGGGRVDLGVLEYTDRVWASDCNDPLERQAIQRWTGLLLPPELIGAHVGPTQSHSTDRTHGVAFRAATALFGHFGIEWDITTAKEAELVELARWVELYKRTRQLLHSGTVVRLDSPDPSVWLHGVVSADRSSGVYAFVRVATSVTEAVGPLALPGLDPNTTYRVSVAAPSTPAGLERRPLGWLAGEGHLATGRVLEAVGLQTPGLFPEHALVIEVTKVD